VWKILFSFGIAIHPSLMTVDPEGQTSTPLVLAQRDSLRPSHTHKRNDTVPRRSFRFVLLSRLKEKNTYFLQMSLSWLVFLARI